jgi:hypothetical protein
MYPGRSMLRRKKDSSCHVFGSQYLSQNQNRQRSYLTKSNPCQYHSTQQKILLGDCRLAPEACGHWLQFKGSHHQNEGSRGTIPCQYGIRDGTSNDPRHPLCDAKDSHDSWGRGMLWPQGERDSTICPMLCVIIAPQHTLTKAIHNRIQP